MFGSPRSWLLEKAEFPAMKLGGSGVYFDPYGRQVPRLAISGPQLDLIEEAWHAGQAVRPPSSAGSNRTC